MNPIHEAQLNMNRRQLLRAAPMALGNLALGGLLKAEGGAFPASGLHHAPRAKRIIYLFQAGAPSQLDLFDYKPKLTELEGKPLPPSVIKGQRYAFIRRDAAVLGPRFKFAKHGKSGAELSDRLPHLAKIVDDIAIVKTVIELGRNLGLRVVAEGVETPEQLELLTELDCDEAQGFFLALPQPAETLLEHLEQGHLLDTIAEA